MDEVRLSIKTHVLTLLTHLGLTPYIVASQAQRQFLEFLHHFYDVFPEYKRMDVSQQVTQTATLHLVLISFLCA